MKTSLDIEYFILGQAINFEKQAEKIINILDEDCFDDKNHKILFRLVKSILKEQLSFSLTLIWEKIKNANLDSFIDEIYLVNMSIDAGDFVELDTYIDFVQEKRLHQNLLKVLEKTSIELSKHQTQNSKTLAKNLKEDLDDLLDREYKSSTCLEKTVEDILFKKTNKTCLFEKLQNRHSFQTQNTQDYFDGLKTGFYQIDNESILLSNGHFIILAARPSMGKTAFAINIALFLAQKTNKRVGFFSLEMSPEQITERVISIITNTSCEDLKRGRFSKEILNKIRNLKDLNLSKNFIISDQNIADINNLVIQAKNIKSRKDIDILFIDYLQLISLKKRSENRQNEIAEISRTIRQLSIELNIPIVCLSQLSRKVEDRNDKRPLISDLRDSGQIEQDADVVMFLHRKDYYSPEEKNGLTEIIIGKNRHGKTFSCFVDFDLNSGVFCEQKEIW